MVTKEEYAQLSLYVYDIDSRTGIAENRPLLPDGWQELQYHPDGPDGFSYGVFRRTGTTEVVIAFAGTNSGIDWVANISGAMGLPSTQITQAALVYAQAKEQYGENITFTGHSLGGGIASTMAVWFDRPATVFDQAPFEATAIGAESIRFTRVAFALAGYSDDSFSGYTGILDFYARELRVTNYFLEGEALVAFRLAFPDVVGVDQDKIVQVNGVDAGPVDLHSQALLTATLLSDDFRLATYASDSVIPLLMDKSFYAYDAATSDQRNVLIDFIRSEQGTGDKLTHFAADLNKLGSELSGEAQKALIAQGIEWYYWQQAGYVGAEFFTQSGNALQYSTAIGDGLANAQNKSVDYVGNWLAPIVNDHGVFYDASVHNPIKQFDDPSANLNSGSSFLNFSNFEQWNVVTAAAGGSVSALDASKTQIFIGGTGGDSFIGGIGNDSYHFNAGDGIDTIIDSDGLGQLIINNQALTSGSAFLSLNGSGNIFSETTAWRKAA